MLHARHSESLRVSACIESARHLGGGKKLP